MPCNSDYLAPSRRESEMKRAARMLVYVKRALGERVHGRSGLAEQARSVYGNGPDRVPELCAAIKGMTEEQRDTIIYDGRNPDARDLADWWDEHQRADRMREKEEAAAARRREVVRGALAKLTPEEVAALGVGGEE